MPPLKVFFVSVRCDRAGGGGCSAPSLNNLRRAKEAKEGEGAMQGEQSERRQTLTLKGLILGFPHPPSIVQSISSMWSLNVSPNFKVSGSGTPLGAAVSSTVQSEAKKGEEERDREKGRKRDRGREEEKEETEESIWREGGVRKKEDTRVVTIRVQAKGQRAGRVDVTAVT